MMEDSLIGQLIAGRYKILDKMGEGGMGVVYLAEHVAIEKRLALKVLLREYARKPDLKERFLREARAAAAIDHENIVDITDFGETPDNSVFFAMEFLDGHDLSHYIKHEGPIAWPRTKRIVSQICRALGAAHAKNIVHRDMKPENIFLIDREGRPDFVKVLDFGIAKVSGSTADAEHRLTRTGMIFGTPEYMSPEQAQGHSPDHRVDIYAVGVIMYEMLTGQVPFKADTFMGILTKHIFEEPVPPSQLGEGVLIPHDVEEIVLKAMRKDREDRFQSMTEMVAAISGASGHVTRTTGDLAAPVRVLSVPSRSREARPALPSGASSSQPDVSEHALATPLQRAFGRGRAVAFAGLVLLLAGGVAAAFLLSAGRAPKPPAVDTSATAASEPLFAVQIDSDPPGARILQGTSVLGTTPAALKLPRSRRSVMLTFVKEGYREHREPFVVDADGKRLAVNLVRLSGGGSEATKAITASPIAASNETTAGARVATPPPPRNGRSTAGRKAEDPSGRAEKRRSKKGNPQRVEDLMNPFN